MCLMASAFLRHLGNASSRLMSKSENPLLCIHEATFMSSFGLMESRRLLARRQVLLQAPSRWSTGSPSGSTIAFIMWYLESQGRHQCLNTRIPWHSPKPLISAAHYSQFASLPVLKTQGESNQSQLTLGSMIRSYLRYDWCQYQFGNLMWRDCICFCPISGGQYKCESSEKQNFKLSRFSLSGSKAPRRHLAFPSLFENSPQRGSFVRFLPVLVLARGQTGAAPAAFLSFSVACCVEK